MKFKILQASVRAYQKNLIHILAIESSEKLEQYKEIMMENSIV